MRVSTSQFQTRSVNSVLEQQAKLGKTQQHLSTGRRILTPADDPVGASRALELTNSIEGMEKLKSNANLAVNRLRAEEAALEQAGNVFQRIRELTIQANNASQDFNSRRFIAAELRERLDQLVGIANATDGNGEYLFSGLSSRTQPFTKTATGVTYNGDQGERLVQVGPERQLPVNHSGFAVFMKLPNGNGDFLATPDAANTGTGVISPGEITNPNATRNYPYRIDFATNPAGDLEYTVTDGLGNVVIPATAYVDDNEIAFDGIAVAIKAAPAGGDGFDIVPSGNQSVFDTLNRLITTLETENDLPAARARVNNVVNRAITELDTGNERILETRASVGARLNAIDTEVDGVEQAQLDMKTTLSAIEDLDYAKAVSEFNLQLVGLQAAQQSYVKVQGLTLFDYIR